MNKISIPEHARKYIYYEEPGVALLHGDCLEVMAAMEPQSVSTIITDPPYGLSFMGRDWDHGVPGEAFWRAALAVCKPGAMMLAFGGTRTHHRLMCAIEDAGWELRDVLMWLYGSGFPKSHDISKAIDKQVGAEREVVKTAMGKTGNKYCKGLGDDRPWMKRAAEIGFHEHVSDIPATPEASRWDGWGTALKPAWESILLARKPLKDNEEHDIIVENLLRLEAQLCLLLPVNYVETHLKLSQQDYDEVCDFARLSAEERQRIREDLLDRTDTSQLISTVNMCLSTVILWRSTLAGYLTDANMSTIETEINRIIDWKTLRSYLSDLTPRLIIEAELKAPGKKLNALPAARYLNAAATSIEGIQMLSAHGHATSRERILPQGALDSPLKPDYLPIVLAMKPLDGTFAQNALKHGVAGIHVDGGRIGTEARHSTPATPKKGTFNCSFSGSYKGKNVAGRWPANVLLDDESADLLDEQSGETVSTGGDGYKKSLWCGGQKTGGHGLGDSGGASRFFYVAKADNDDRGNRPAQELPLFGETVPEFRNTHPTVKPTALAHRLLQVLSYLARLTESPTGGTVLDPFGGSGWMPVVCKAVGRPCIMIEKDKAHLDIAVQRLRQNNP